MKPALLINSVTRYFDSVEFNNQINTDAVFLFVNTNITFSFINSNLTHPNICFLSYICTLFLAFNMYVIVDVETTGGSWKSGGRITEIAAYRHDGERVVEEFSTLINPQCYIPYSITELTGITNEMVEDAPTFADIARHLLDVTSDAVFVAHNATFDYNFIKAEFEAVGYSFERNVLCTVKLSRKLLPGFDSYSLGNLAEILNIPINGRHRAAGDAIATCTLFDLLMSKNGGFINVDDPYKQFDFSLLNSSISLQTLSSLTVHSGIVLFYDRGGQVLDINLYKNVKEGMYRTLGLAKTKNQKALVANCADFEVIDVPANFVGDVVHLAMMIEKRPLMVKLKLPGYSGIFLYTDQLGYKHLYINEYSGSESAVTLFSSPDKALEWLYDACAKYRLCGSLVGFQREAGKCSFVASGSCDGACVGDEPAESYNRKVDRMLSSIPSVSDNMVVIDKNMDNGNIWYVVVYKCAVIGYGCVSVDSGIQEISTFTDSMVKLSDNMALRSLVNYHVYNNKSVQVINY